MQTQKIKKSSLTLQYSTLKSTRQHNSWHPGAGIEWPGEKSYWLEEAGSEVAELKDGQQQEMGASCSFAHLFPLMDRTFASLNVYNLKVRM